MLLLLALVCVMTVRMLNRLPDSIVYLVKSEATFFQLVPVGRRIAAATPQARLEAAVQELIAGPTGAEQARGLTSEVPEGTRIHQLTLQGGTVVVDLSSSFAQGGGTAMMTSRLNQLFYTLTQSAEIDEVSLLIDGVPVRHFSGEGLLVPQPWRRPAGEGLPTW